MSNRWAASIPLTYGGEALRLWKTPAVEVCVVEDRLWLRGDDWNDDLDSAVRAMLGSERFSLESEMLSPHGHALPVARAPAGPWTPLCEWFQPATPPRKFSARVRDRTLLRLVRSDEPLAINLLMTARSAWHEYAVAAPAVRLARWSFAASDDGQVIVRGAPTPPLAGVHYVEADGIGVPAGWKWSPQLDVDVLRQVFALEKGDLLLLATDGSYELIQGDDFVRATRSAVRLTARSAQC
jgi:hypothetical protein